MRVHALLSALIATAGAGLIPTTASAQDFDCRQASTIAETSICGSRHLKSMDIRMADAYGQLWQVMSDGAFSDRQRLAVRQEQREFLSSREECRSDYTCLVRAYKNRLDQLGDAIEGAMRERRTRS
jgi:uncharacterized protein